jgi:hypothetical protein
MPASSPWRRWLALLLIAVAAIAVAVAFVLHTSGRPSARSAAHDYRPQPEWTFFWGTNARAPFSTAQLDDIARTRHVAVIAGSLDHFDLSAQEAAARALKARNPALKVLFYFNTKHYFDQTLHPNYMRGFDPSTMALRGPDAEPLPFHVSAHRPTGIGWYVDETSPAWHTFYLRTARQIMAAGSFDGIAMDSLRPLTATIDPSAVAALSPAQIAAWNAGQLELLREVRAAFPDKIVLYNGISQGVPGQIDRDLGPLSVAGAALNEGFCLTHGVPSSDGIRNDLALMATAARHHKILLEKVNSGHRGNGATFGDFCFGAFLLGFAPGSSYFDFSAGYGIDQLDTLPAEADLDLGPPVAAASFRGEVGVRAFRNGSVYVNLGDAAATVSVAGPAWQLANRVVVADYPRGGTVTLAPHQAAFFVNRRP